VKGDGFGFSKSGMVSSFILAISNSETYISMLLAVPLFSLGIGQSVALKLYDSVGEGFIAE
jgi:hypothetical protein